MSFVVDLMDYLEDAGVGQIGQNLFESGAPSRPINALRVRSAPGAPSDLTQNRSPYPAYHFPAAQVLARGESHPEAYGLIVSAYQTLSSVQAGITINGRRYLWWRPLHPPYETAADDNDRPVYLFNIAACQAGEEIVNGSQTQPG